MALSLGKITILLGVGLAGSAIAKKEGLLPDVSGLVSGAFKVLRQLQSPDYTPTVKNPPNDALRAQVDSLRQEIEFLIREKSIIFVSPSGS